MKRQPKFTKAGNYLLRSTRSIELIKLAILAQERRVVLDTNSWRINKKSGQWAANCNWDVTQLIKHGLAGTYHNLLELTPLGKEMLDGAWANNPKITKLRVLREIEQTETN